MYINCVIKLKHCIKKKGKKVQKGVFIIYLLLSQRVHGAEVMDILGIADIVDVSDMADIASGYREYCEYCGYCSIVIGL